MDENYVYEQIACLSNKACQRMNAFSSQILKTRGGRIGSGMGTLWCGIKKVDSLFSRIS